MTLSVSISITALVAKLTEEEQARFFDAAISGCNVDEELLRRLTKLNLEAQAVVG